MVGASGRVGGGLGLVSWLAILGLAAGAYGFKAAGIFGLSRVPLRGTVQRVIQLLPAAMLAALVVAQTLPTGDDAVSWSRVAGVAVGCVAVWRKAPLLVVLLVSAATTALIRLA